jgi:stress response protein YsnF
MFMTPNEQRPVIGIFRDRTLAEQAINELRQEGWSNDQMHLFGQQGGGLFSSFKGANGSQDFTIDDPMFQGLSDEQRNQYQHAFEQGHSIVAVYTDTRPLEVRDTLHRFGAMNVLLPSYQGQERVIPLRREDVTIQKTTDVIGELRIHKRIITENKTFTVPVTREEVTIERLPVTPPSDQQSAQTSPSDSLPSFQNSPKQQSTDMPTTREALENGGTLRILVHEERVIIQKQSMVVEEILIQKQVMEETRHLSVPVRHEEAYIEQHGTFQVHGNIEDGMVETSTSVPPG